MQLDARIVFLDLDGTTLAPDLTMTTETIDAINASQEAGVHVVFASGRPATSVARFTNQLQRSQYIIASNGGAVVASDLSEVLHCSAMSRSVARDVDDLLAGIDVSLCVYGPCRWFARERDHWVELEAERSGANPTLASDPVGAAEPIVKLMVIGEPGRLADLSGRLNRWSNQLEWYPSYPEYLEIMPRGVSKAEACKHILSALNLPQRAAIAIGDGLNDRGMFEVVGLRVAVRNAHPDILALVDVVAPSNAESGVACALQALVLGDPNALARLDFEEGRG
jgi:Cof subfamily protein (haloacid dehalogenase superfamily)